MTIDSLKRVMWRLEGLKRNRISGIELRRAIMFECGTDLSTYHRNREALTALGWIIREKRKFRISHKHLTEDIA